MKYIPAIILGFVSAALFIAAYPTPGGTDANVILGVPAIAFGVLAAIAGGIAYAI